MIYINEWLPNPVGNDAAGEFIELYNSSAGTASLDGYTLSDGAKKRFSLGGTISSGGYLVLKKADDKLSLKNTDGALWLYGPSGYMLDQASFAGVAPEGKSFSRVDYGTAAIGHFAFEYPTPGTANKTIDVSVESRDYPMGESLASHLSPAGFVVLMLAVAVSFLVFFVYVARSNRNISNFFFGGNEKTGI